MQGLAGKRVLITGASSGIGAGMARVLAKYGCRLVLHYNANRAGVDKTLADVQALGAQARIVYADFRQLGQLRAFFEQAWQQFDGLDALINNAGVVSKVVSLKDADGEQFNQTLAVNLQAPYQLSSYFAQACIEAEQAGSIVNNSSIHAQQTCEWFAAYAASKAALDAITKVHAVEWGAMGIRVNVLAPGVVPVERTDGILDQPKLKQKWMARTPLQRYGLTEEMGEATAFLLSDLSLWMTGSVMTVDGGLIARGNYPQRD